MIQLSSESRSQGMFDRLLNSCFKKSGNRPSGNFKCIIRVTNKETKSQLLHGRHFKYLIEPRDHVLEHDYDFTFELTSDNWDQENELFMNSQGMKVILMNVKKFLLEASTNVVSVAFKFLQEGRLEGSQVKDYAAKNILVNTQSIFRQLINALSQPEQLRARVHMDDVRDELTVEFDSILNNIMVNLADNYPQAPPSGGTQRMKEVIQDVNRTDDEENDLIFNSNIKISDFIAYNQSMSSSEAEKQLLFDEDRYTSFIMSVINEVITITQKSQLDSRQRSTRQIFNEFNQQLFYLTKQKKYTNIINSLSDKKIKKIQPQDNFQLENIKQKITLYFDKVLQRNQDAVNNIFQKMQNQQYNSRIRADQRKSFKSNLNTDIDQIIYQTDEGIQNMQKNSNYALGQKVPSFVTPFDKKQMITSSFTTKHSSILRILTKWAQNLEEIFQKPRQIIYNRLYVFKTFENQLIPSSISSIVKVILIQRLQHEYSQLKQKFQAILKSNYHFIGVFMSHKNDSFADNVCNYSQTRTLSSKISAVLTSLMVRYTCHLIHHLLKAGHAVNNQMGHSSIHQMIQKQIDKQKKLNINLITFKVTDLLRSKLQCSQTHFLNLLKTLYFLDNTQSLHSKFKLTRIKNKLDTPSSNIIINYLLLGKVQCQLQLSIHDIQGKSKHYYNMSHFIYELVRGQFGAITENAIIVSQLDPMIAGSKDVIYQQKSMERLIKKEIGFRKSRQQKLTGGSQSGQRLVQDNKSKVQLIIDMLKSQVFQCPYCSRLSIKQNRGIFDLNQQICHNCIIKSRNIESLLKNKPIKDIIQRQLKRGTIRKVNSIQDFKSIKQYQSMIMMHSNRVIDYAVAIPSKNTQDTLIIRITAKILEQIGLENFQFKDVDYISAKEYYSGGSRKNGNATFIFYLIDKQFQYDEEFANAVSIPQYLLRTKVKTFIQQYIQYLQQKRIICTIKFKTQILNYNDSVPQWKLLDKIGRVLTLGQGKQNRIDDRMRYKVYNTLQFQHIKTLQAAFIKLQQLPKWLFACKNLKQLNISNNMLRCIRKQQLPPNLIELSAQNNIIQTIQLSLLKKLTKLTLTNNKITQLQLIALVNLKELYANHNYLKKIDLSSLVNLKILQVQNTKIQEINISKNKNIVKINLRNNGLTYVDFTYNQILQDVDISNNKFVIMNLCQYSELKKITMIGNPIQELKLSDLNRLAKVDLDRTPTLRSAVLTNLYSVTSVSFKSCRLFSLQLTNLPNLQTLTIPNNPIESLSLFHLTNLTKFSLQQSKLNSIKLYNLPKLSQLCLKNNQLTTIDINTLYGLTYLDLSNNKLSYVPIGNQNKLQTLILDNNELTYLDLTNQTQLVQLSVANNQLPHIHLNNQTKLLHLDVSSNRLQYLYLNEIVSLKTLNVLNNPSLKLDALPQTLTSLQADKQTIAECNFKRSNELKQITLPTKDNGTSLSNLNPKVKIRSKNLDQ